MKKNYYIILSFLCIFILFGCSSKEEKAEKKDIDELVSMGFSKSSAKEFYKLSSSFKTIFNNMSEINKSEKDYIFNVTNEEYKTIVSAIETSKEAYKELVPKKFDEYEDYLNSEKQDNPIFILKSMENKNRDFYLQGAEMMMYDMLTYFAKSAIESSGLSNNERIKAIKWYHSNNNYTDLFKEVYDLRTNFGKELD